VRIGGGRFLNQLRSPQSSSDAPREQAGLDRKHRVRRPRFREGGSCRLCLPQRRRRRDETRYHDDGGVRGTDGSNPASSSGESGANSLSPPPVHIPGIYPFADDLGPGRLRHVDDRQHLVGASRSNEIRGHRSRGKALSSSGGWLDRPCVGRYEDAVTGGR
jgi:hypothetical protein